MNEQEIEHQVEAAKQYLAKGGKLNDWIDSKSFDREDLGKIEDWLREDLGGKI